MKSRLNIAMAGGGTGGHVFPIKSLIEYISNKNEYSSKINKIYWFGEKNSLEYNTFSKLKKTIFEIRFINILSGKFRRETILKSRLKNIRDIFLFIAGFFQSLFRLIYFKIDLVFCKGGYVALPVVFAGALLRKKIIVHESDTRSGLVNKIASKFAHKIFTGFDGVFNNSETVGQIISDEIIVTEKDISSNNTTLLEDDFKNTISQIDKDKTLVLVVGGSQGSKKLYETIQKIIKESQSLKTDFVFFISLGLLNKSISSLFKDFSNVYTFDFLTQKQMGTLCYICDIGITRAGTTSLAEQKLYDMKLIIIPIPRTHDQYKNASYYTQKYADIMVDQRDENFLNNLSMSIKKHKKFKKKSRKKNKLEEISVAKDKIIKEILGV